MADKFQEIERLARLLDEGKLTQQEFEALKQVLLKQPPATGDRVEATTTTPSAPTIRPAPKPTKKKREGINVAYAVLGIILVILLILNGGFGSSSGDSSENGSAVGAFVACQQFVEDRLKAPSTAKFGGTYSQATSSLASGRYRVRTYVDSQNSFGAMVRTGFDCTVRHTGSESYRLESLTFDE
jgi:hypothetical protein